MAWQLYPGGLRRTYGHPIVSGSYLYTSSESVWWVNSEFTGSPGGGKDEYNPLSSIVAAHTIAASGDIVVCMDGHQEPAAAVTLTKQLFICGAGRTGDVPNCSFLFDGANTVDVQGTGTLISNFKFAGRSAAASDTRLAITASNVEISDCYFDCTKNDERGISIGTGTYNRIINSVFVSNGIGTGAAERPGTAIRGGSTITDLTVEGCTFDSGAYGWEDIYAVDFYNQVVTRVRFKSNSQLRGADFRVGSADPVNSFFAGGTQTGGAMIRTY